MRRLIMWNMVTLDGYFDGERSWQINWHKNVWGEDLERFALESQSAETLLLERPTYERMTAYWSAATGEIADRINAIPKVVFSRSLKKADWNNSRLVSTDPAREVASLKRKPGNDLVIFGGAALPATLAQRGLIDEYRLGVHPVVLGDGGPLSGAASQRSRMNLLEATTSQSGRTVLCYQANGASPTHAAHERLRPGRGSARVALSRRRSVVDGPFVETKEWALG
ncbi:MAG: dihydrofolate reductase family protein [Woeseia sp.]